MRKMEDLTGIRSGKLVAMSFAYRDPRTRTNYWLCKCDCGNEKAVPGTYIKRGLQVSCGCYIRESASKRFTKHGLSQTRENRIWRGMKMRCLNPKNQDYHHYGGRGIKVCDEWLHSFENFYRDMGPCGNGMTLDRIDPNGNYEPSNCRWASWEVQRNNTRMTKFVAYAGETLSVSQWERRLGVRNYQLANWLRKGGLDGHGLGRTIESFMAARGINL